MTAINYSTLNGFETTQLWDKKMMGYLWHRRTEFDPTQVSYLDALFKKKLKQIVDGQTPFTYAFPKNKVGELGYGRLFGPPGSLEWIERDLRATLAHKFYDDVDMVNCHPTLAVKLAQKYKLELPITASYVNDREGVFRELNIDPSDGKTLVVALFNGKGLSDLPEHLKNHHIIVGIKREMSYLTETLIKSGDHQELYDYIKKQKKNVNGSFIATILQTEERKCLEVMVDVLLGAGYSVDVLAYDGAMVRKATNHPLTDTILRQIEEAILARLGYNMKVKVKSMMDEVIPIDELKDEDIVDEDVEITEKYASEKYIELMGADIVKQDGVVFIYDRETGVWISGDDNIQHSIIKHSNKLKFKQIKDGKVRTVAFAQSNNSLVSIKQYISKLLVNTNFIRDSSEKSKGCLLFSDGWYDMKAGVFHEGFDETCRDMVFLRRIKYSYPKTVDLKVKDELYKVLFINPYNNERDGEFYANGIARAMAGHTEDKRLVLIVGNPNCGKSTQGNLMKDVFDEFVGSFNMNSLKFNKNTSDEAKKLSWIMPLAGCRIIVGNEVRMDGCSLDGNMIKSFTGNDPFIVRCNFKDETVFKMTAIPFAFVNDIGPITPADEALKNRIVAIPHTKSFVRKPQSECNEYEMEADPTLHEKLKGKEYRDAYLHIILDAYRRGEILSKPSTVVEEINDLLPIEEGTDLRKRLEEEFEFVPSTPEGEDNYVPFARVFNYLRDNGIKSSKTKVGRELKKIGLKVKEKKINKRVITVYYGLKDV